MAKLLRNKKSPRKKKLGEKITSVAEACREIVIGIKKIVAAYRKRQLKQYKKCAKFKKKTGFWKFKKLKKLKKAKFSAYKPRKVK